MSMGVIQRTIDFCASRTVIYNGLRNFLEGGFRKQGAIIRAELGGIGGMVIDVGCGTGTYAGLFDPGRYIGIDIDPRYVSAAARRWRGHQFSQMDATAMRFEDGTFAAGLLAGVVHHLDDRLALSVLLELRRVICRGGKLMFLDQTHSPASNPVGCMINRMDKGDRIRCLADYRALVSAYFVIEDESIMRSRFVDYVVLKAIRTA